VPIIAVALVLALFLKEIPLSEHAGMVARGEAVESEEELARLLAPEHKVLILDGDLLHGEATAPEDALASRAEG